MKKSSKLLLTAILVVIISLGIYDAELRSEYRQGTNKNPHQTLQP